MLDAILEKSNLKRQVAITVSHFRLAPFVLAIANLIATLVERVVRTYPGVLGLLISPLAYETPGLSVTRPHQQH